MRPEIDLAYRSGRFEIDGREPMHGLPDPLRDLLIANPGIKTQQFQNLARDKNLGRNKARDFLDDGVQSKTIRKDTGLSNARFYTWIGGETGPEKEML